MAILTTLDLLVTVDTAVAHLAGAMGVQTALLLPKAADWRWLLDRAVIPWYPAMRLFRQTAADVWGDQATRAAAIIGILPGTDWNLAGAH